MGISDGIIHAWRAVEKKNKGGEKSASILEEEVESLRRQLRQTELERDILKKAVAIFSRMLEADLPVYSTTEPESQVLVAE